MGRLKRGESLISKLMSQGIEIFPPSPPEKRISSVNSKRYPLKPPAKKGPKKKKIENVIVLSSKSDYHESSESDSHESSKEEEEEEEEEEESHGGQEDDISSEKDKNIGPSESEDSESFVERDLLSKLVQFPSKILKKASSNSSSKAETVKRALLSYLVSQGSSDLESMIEKSNKAFESLTYFGSNFKDFYESVKYFLSCHYKLAEAKRSSELVVNRSMKEMIARQNILFARSNGEVKALLNAKSSLAKEEENVVTLASWVGETRALLEELEEKLERKVTKIDDLRMECDKLEKSYEATMSEQRTVVEEMEVCREIGDLREKAETRVDIARSRLFIFF